MGDYTSPTAALLAAMSAMGDQASWRIAPTPTSYDPERLRNDEARMSAAERKRQRRMERNKRLIAAQQETDDGH